MSISLPLSPVQRWAALALSSVLCTAAFPPLDVGWLAWFGLIGLLAAVLSAPTPRAAFGFGTLFGWAHWGVTVLFVGQTVTRWTGSPVGWLAWVGLTAVQALFFGLGAWAVHCICVRDKCITVKPAAVAAAWVVMEWLRGQGPVAMPWSLLGYTQYRCAPVLQLASLGGVYLLSWTAAWVNAAALAALQKGASKRILTETGITAAVLLILSLFARAGGGEEEPEPGRSSLSVAAVQTNRTSGTTQQQDVEGELQHLRRLSGQIRLQAPALVVWPESASPEDAFEPSQSRALFEQAAQHTGAWQLFGSGRAENNAIFNSSALLRPNGQLAAWYDKHWLVPFGEWIPLRPLFAPLNGVFQFPPDVTSGTRDTPLSVERFRIAPLICYESIFPVMARRRTWLGADLLVNLTNDSWAGNDTAPRQHFAMNVVRAVEVGRPLLCAATTGVTCFVNPNGSFHALPTQQEGVLYGEVRRTARRTVSTMLGDWVPALGALAAALELRKSRRPSRDPEAEAPPPQPEP
jgi:apolipoprotein N-acyltransferase